MYIKVEPKAPQIFIAIVLEKFHLVKALVAKNSVLHDFGFGKESPTKQL